MTNTFKMGKLRPSLRTMILSISTILFAAALVAIGPIYFPPGEETDPR